MKIICIGRNYRAHAEELHRDMGLAADAAEPIWFLKPDTALLRNNDPFYIPAFSHEVHYECELVVRIDRVGRSIAEKFAHRYYREVGLGIDFTARDLQREAIAKGLPWEPAKGVRPFGGALARISAVGRVGRRRAEPALRTCRQRRGAPAGRYGRNAFHGRPHHRGRIAIHHPAHGRPDLHRHPAGVGPVAPGDCLTATLEGRRLLDFDIR